MSNIVSNTGLKGRWQILSNNPLIVCDTAHNEDGLLQVLKQIEQTPFKSLHIVFGLVNDKNVSKVLSMMPKYATYYFTRASIPRALDEKELKLKAEELHLNGSSYSTVAEALNQAKKNAKKEDFIFVGGSTFVVAEV